MVKPYVGISAVLSFSSNFDPNKRNTKHLQFTGITRSEKGNFKIENGISAKKFFLNLDPTALHLVRRLNVGYRCNSFESISLLSEHFKKRLRMELIHPIECEEVHVEDRPKLTRVFSYKTRGFSKQMVVDSSFQLSNVFETGSCQSLHADKSEKEMQPSEFKRKDKIWSMKLKSDFQDANYVLSKGLPAFMLDRTDDRVYFKYPGEKAYRAISVLQIKDNVASVYLLSFNERFSLPDKFNPSLKFFADEIPALLF